MALRVLYLVFLRLVGLLLLLSRSEESKDVEILARRISTGDAPGGRDGGDGVLRLGRQRLVRW